MKTVLTVAATLFAVFMYQSFNEYLAAHEAAAIAIACKPAVRPTWL
jgi:hypothetical protein